jgi:hypothetical protein
MRTKVAKRLRRSAMILTNRSVKSDSQLIHKNSDPKRKDYHTAILKPNCTRAKYQQLKKQYYQERRHA